MTVVTGIQRAYIIETYGRDWLDTGSVKNYRTKMNKRAVIEAATLAVIAKYGSENPWRDLHGQDVPEPVHYDGDAAGPWAMDGDVLAAVRQRIREVS